MSIAIAYQSLYNSGVVGGAAAHDIDPPAGMTTGHLDLLIAVAGNAASSAPVVRALDDVAFTSLAARLLNSSGAARVSLDAWWRPAAAAPATVEVEFDGGGTSARCLAWRAAVADVDLADPIAVAAASWSEGAAKPGDDPVFTVPGVTTPVDGCLAVAVLAWATSHLGAAPYYTATAGWSATSFNSVISGATTHPSGAVFVKPIPAAGATGACVFTPSRKQHETSVPWAGIQFALRPAEGGPPPRILSRPMGFLLP